MHMCQADIQETARFVREFLTMSLVPWMEKCVVDWNEAVSALSRFPFFRTDFVVFSILLPDVCPLGYSQQRVAFLELRIRLPLLLSHPVQLLTRTFLTR